MSRPSNLIRPRAALRELNTNQPAPAATAKTTASSLFAQAAASVGLPISTGAAPRLSTGSNASAAGIADPQAVEDYARRVLLYRRTRDVDMRVDAGYLSQHQPELNEKMRSILVDWLVEVHNKFKMDNETLFLAVHLMDRYLCVRKVARSKFQLLGITCLLIASKYEDTYPPEIKECVYMTDHAYTATDVLDMEVAVLNALEFNVTVPSPLYFLSQLLNAERASGEVASMAQFLLELCLPEYRMLRHSAPELAAGVMYLAKVIVLGVREPWTTALAGVAQAAGSEARAVARTVGSVLQAAMRPSAPQQAVRKKFTPSTWHHAVRTAVRWLESRGVEPKELVRVA